MNKEAVRDKKLNQIGCATMSGIKTFCGRTITDKMDVMQIDRVTGHATGEPNSDGDLINEYSFPDCNSCLNGVITLRRKIRKGREQAS